MVDGEREEEEDSLQVLEQQWWQQQQQVCFQQEQLWWPMVAFQANKEEVASEVVNLPLVPTQPPLQTWSRRMQL